MELGIGVGGKIQESHFSWNKPIWFFKLLHKLGRDKKKCGVTVIDRAVITHISLTSKSVYGRIGHIEFDPDKARRILPDIPPPTDKSR